METPLKHRFIIVVFEAVTCLLISTTAYGQKLEAYLALMPDRTEIHLDGDTHLPLTLTCHANKEPVSYEWFLNGPGTLEGNLATSRIRYLPPAKIEEKFEMVFILVKVTDATGQIRSSDVVLTLLAQGTSSPPDQAYEQNHPEASSDSAQLAPPPMFQRTGDLYVVIIGAAAYQSDDFPALPFGECDAQAVYQLITDSAYGGIAADHVKFLVGAEVTERKIKRILGTWLAQHADYDDTILIYVIGQGAYQDGESYWITYDADAADLFSTALSGQDLKSSLKRIHAKHRVLFLDLNYGVTVPFQTRQTSRIPWEVFPDDGCLVLSASDGNGLNPVRKDEQHGVFTCAVIEGLRGKADYDKDYCVTLEEVWQYLDQQMTQPLQSPNAAPQPQRRGSLAEEIVLAADVVQLRQQREREARECRKKRLIELYRHGQVSVEQFQRALKQIETGQYEQPLLDLLNGTLSLEQFQQIF